MELVDIPGVDLGLQLTETMLQDLPDELDRTFRIGELSCFDAVELAARGGSALAPEVQVLAREHAFSVVRIPISVRPPERATVRFLAVEVALRSDGDRAVSWSMDPEAVTDPVTVSTTLAVTAALTVAVAEVGPEAERTAEYVVRQPRITAFNVGAVDPAWEFLPTRASRLSGVQLLHLVVKAPERASWSGTVSVRADVTYRQMLWNTRAVRRDGELCVATFTGP